jgi:hypothetical protein
MINGKMTEPEKWHGMNKMYAELDKELKKEYADIPDTPVTRKLLADIAYLRRESFNNWMKENHPGETPIDIRWPDLDDEV